MRRMLDQLKTLWGNVEARLMRYEWLRPSNSNRRILNNSSWLEKVSMLEIMGIMAPGMKIGAMLGRDS